MDKLLVSALEGRNRTPVTTLFARSGFKIATTNFDDVTFEKDDVQVEVHFNLASNVKSVNIVTKQ
ncbi:hypothetical protein L4C33_13500 [Vibrio makurazakiensis]|uniref:hypothetical protein n=1 Tax=Vibrio makurazakiensis TaxID=2910250 RepID=UPI003D141CF1